MLENKKVKLIYAVIEELHYQINFLFDTNLHFVCVKHHENKKSKVDICCN